MKLLTQWAFTSSALILIVLAVRRLFREKLSARLRYALWGVVLLRLLIPFQVELPAAASDALPVLATNMAQDVSPWLEDQMLYAVPTERYLVDRVQPGEDPEYSRTLHSEADREYYSGGVVYDKNGITRYLFMMPASELLTMLWGTGTALAALVILTSNLRFARQLRKRRERLKDVDAPAPVYVAEGLPSPCLFGVFRPAVYVTPQAVENPDTLRHVLAHELTHYAHKDHLWSLLRCLALALHWYNPLVWLAVVLSKQDGELACDEGAVARLGEGERIPYGRTLVDMVAARSLRPGDLLSCSTAMTGGEKSIKQRVTQIVKKPETVKIALFAAVALVALGLVFTFAGRAQGEKGDYATFLNDVENAQSIHLGQEMISSYRGPAITDPELLSQAKELLRKDAADWLNPPQVLEDVNLMDMRTLILTGQDGQEVRYRLIRRSTDQQSDFYVITDGSISNIRGSRVSVVLKQDTIYQLDELTRQQDRGGNTVAPSSSPELDTFLADLDSATSIRYCPPSYSNYFYRETITDPRLLANVRERLSYLVPLEAEDATPDGKQLLDASRLVLTTEAGEVTYNLIPYNGYTYVTRGSGDYSVQENGRTAYLRTRTQTNLSGSISALARTQELLSQDPLTPVPMTRAELGGYSLADICETLGYQLQGWGGDPEDAELVSGHTMQDRILLCYNGDETHLGHWMLTLKMPSLDSNQPPSGFTVQSDQPEVVRNAALYRLSGSGWKNFEVMTPDIFAVCLRPEDVISVKVGTYAVDLDIPALREQLTQALYHQFSDEYDREKHGQYVLTIRVQGSGMEAYMGRETAEDADRLTLSAGSEKDVVCLSHRNFAATPEPTRLFVRSPELYAYIVGLAQTNGALRGYLTRAQVEQINEAFRDEVKLPDGGWGSSEISCFFTSSYNDPTQIDLEEFLAYCPLAEILENDEVEEFQAVIKKDGSWNDWEYGLDSPGNLPVPTKRYPREKVSALLQKYAGVKVEELDWSGCLYLEKYDAFYNFTSDFGPGFFPCVGGQIMEDSVLLWSDPNENGDRCELVLRKNGDGWLIQSHHTIYER